MVLALTVVLALFLLLLTVADLLPLLPSHRGSSATNVRVSAVPLWAIGLHE